MDCGHHCHEIGEPWIAENPDCPIHGANGLHPDDARDIIRELVTALRETHAITFMSDELSELISRAEALL